MRSDALYFMRSDALYFMRFDALYFMRSDALYFMRSDALYFMRFDALHFMRSDALDSTFLVNQCLGFIFMSTFSCSIKPSDELAAKTAGKMVIFFCSCGFWSISVWVPFLCQLFLVQSLNGK